ncbi:MAG TPA: hypothetical protein V6D25_05880 [Leptolyngbyaceae cyanobacterium]
MPVQLVQAIGKLTLNRPIWSVLVDFWFHDAEGNQDRENKAQKRELNFTFLLWIVQKPLSVDYYFPYDLIS